MTLTRGFIRNAVTTPLDARLMDMSGIVCNADGTPRAGVLGTALGVGGAIVSTTATMSVNVAAGEFVTTKGKADGVAIFTNDGTVAVAIAAAPASNSRIDVIYVKHNDDTTGDADALPVFGVVTGTAAASPVKPAVPTGALELATLRVYAGTTASNGGSNVLTNTYQMTAARGGVVPVRDSTERSAWTAPDGALTYQLDTDELYVRANGAWALISGLVDYGPLDPAVTAIYGAGWSNYASGGWSGTRYWRRSRIVYVNGSSAKTSWAAGETILTLPAGSRPPGRIEGIGVTVEASGAVITKAAGSVAMTLAASFPV